MTRIGSGFNPVSNPRSSALHGFLFICERDIHLLKSDLVERARHLEPFRLLILPQSITRRIIKLAELLSGVKAPLLPNRLRLVDLLLRSAKDRAAFGALLRCRLGCG